MENHEIPSKILSLKLDKPVRFIIDEKAFFEEKKTKAAARKGLSRSMSQGAESSPETSTEENSYSATTTAFGLKNTPVVGVVTAKGDNMAFLDLSKKTINLSQLIDQLPPEIGDLFVFDEAKIALDEQKKMISFNGILRMEGPVLGAFKKFFKMETGPSINASIDAEGQDLSTKIRPSNISFTCSYSYFLQLTPDLTLSEAVFQLQLEKDKDTQKWTVTPSAKGVLTFANLAKTPVKMSADILYNTDGLTVTASVAKAESIFNIDKLDLEGLKVKFQSGEATSLDLSASFKSGKRTFDFAGKVTSGFVGLTASATAFTSEDLNDLFRTLSGNALGLPDYQVDFEEVTVAIASAKGKVNGKSLERGVQLGCKLTVHEHECEAKAMISTDYVSFDGTVKKVEIGPVKLKEATLRMQFATAASKKATEFAILGKMTVKTLDLNAKVAYEKEGSDWNVVVYAGLEANSFGLSTLFPETKGTFPDSFRFSKAAIIYSKKDSDTKDPDFNFKVKSGLQLTGTLEEVPAISSLTRSKSLGMQLTALLGKTTSIGIDMPASSALSLGPSVTCDPFSLVVQLTPKPELDMIFGMNVKVAKQDQPLHFDFKLGVGIEGATGSGTMKGYWKNPFGLTGFQVGPELALQADIIYAQFFSTGTPSGFGFAGGIRLGDVIGKMALSISADPSHNILYGEVENLSPSNLVKFASDISRLNLPADAVPDFFNLKQLKLYCAPVGGSIGTITYPQGFSFACNLVLFGKSINMFAAVNDSGVSAKGSIEAFEVGPLQLKGANGQNAQVALDLTTDKQAILIDGAIDFMGFYTGLFLDVSKDGAAFKFEQKFANVLSYMVAGKSTGSFSQPSRMDFELTAVLDNNITDFLRTTVVQKINDAISAVDKSISDLQADLTRKEIAYKKEFEPANRALIQAQADADAYLKKCQKDVRDEKAKWEKTITDAQTAVTDARNTYNNALNDAKNALTNAENAYNAALTAAQNDVSRTQRDYENTMSSAQRDVEKARNAYNSTFGSVQNALNSAQASVNSIQNDINAENRKWDNYSGWEKAYRWVDHGAIIAGLETAKATANVGLEIAKAAVNAFARSSEAIAFGAANAALEVAKKGVSFVAFESAKAALIAVQTGAKYTAFEGARQAINIVQNGSEFLAWQTAQKALDLTRSAGHTSLDAAALALGEIANSAAYIALEVAKVAVEAVKEGTAAVTYEQAKVYLEGARLGSKAVLELSKFIALHAGDIIDVKHIDFYAKLSDIKNGKLFKSNIKILVFNQPYNWSIDFNVSNVTGFIDNLFQAALAEAKKIASLQS